MNKKFISVLAIILFCFALLFSFGATWNADKPAVGNQISEDIPDIEENFQELHDVIEAITDGELGTTTAANFHIKAIGYTERSKFSRKDDDEIYIGVGAYDVYTKLARWDSTLTKQLTGLSTNTWYYIYLDYSEITDGTAITATEVIYTTTAPSWSDSKHGWYNGNDRCIFAVRTDGDGDIHEFYHSGQSVFMETITTLSSTDIDVDWVTVTLIFPGFAQGGYIYYYLNPNSDTDTVSAWWRTYGASAAQFSHGIGQADADSAYPELGTIEIMASTDQKIQVNYSAAGDHKMTIRTAGWKFPTGM